MIESLRTATSIVLSLRRASDHAEAMKPAQDTYGRFQSAAMAASRRRNISARSTWRVTTRPMVSSRRRSTCRSTCRSTSRGALTSGLGENHPHTLVTANNLACYLRVVGHFGEALALAEDANTRMRERLGGEHLMSLSAVINLSNCLANAGHLSAAESLERSTLATCTWMLGAYHPNALRSLLAASQRKDVGQDVKCAEVRCARLDYDRGVRDALDQPLHVTDGRERVTGRKPEHHIS
jgi:hypothetical protein